MSDRRFGLSRAQRLVARRAHAHRRLGRLCKLVSGVVLFTVLATLTGVTWWTTGGIGIGNGLVGGLDAPTGVAAVANGTTVHLSWTGVTPPGSGTFGYVIERFSGGPFGAPTPAGGTCTSSVNAPLPPSPQSCDDVAVAPGGYQYRVTAVFGTWTTASVLSNVVNVFALDHFAIAAPASTTAGNAITLTVTAKDASNATITNYTGTVSFQSSDANATIPADFTFGAADLGVHAFVGAYIPRTAGQQSVSVRDTVLMTATGSASFVVNPGPLDHFVITAPVTATAGTPFTLTTVSARDAYGNVASSWSTSIHCVTFGGAADAPDGTPPSYPARGSCAPGESQLTFDGSGNASGSTVTLFNAATTNLTVTVTGKTGTSANINVGAAGPSGLAFVSASNRNGAVTVSCTGLVAALTCTPSAQNEPGNGRIFNAGIGLVDAYRNPTANTTGSAVAVALSSTGGNSLTPASLTIATGQSTSTSGFTASLRNGSSTMTITATASLNAASVTAAVTTA